MRDDVKRLADALREHLTWWGLRRFKDDRAYSQWQRETIPAKDLNELNRLVEQRRTAVDGSADEAFYDHAAQPDIAPVLYSQRYDYYLAVGPLVTSRIADARTILDFGCGTGILTTFYAQRFPDQSFLGIDRSAASIALAQAKAHTLGLTNVRFERMDVERGQIPKPMDLVLSTHALLQSEQDLGIPSDSWETFRRAADVRQQRDFEQRTGLGRRLDGLCQAIQTNGRLIVFEKTRLLARRVPFQRALATRGFSLLEQAVLVRYVVIDEVSDDGPLYHVMRSSDSREQWDESPEMNAADQLDLRGVLSRSSGTPPQAMRGEDSPLYENHTAAAQQLWQSLPGRAVQKSKTFDEADGRQMHIELGTTEGVIYLYWANTFDQRQLVLIEPERGMLLEQYYGELIEGGKGATPQP